MPRSNFVRFSFPLFPTGVETYRFEYAVFLLNKDIEMVGFGGDLRVSHVLYL